MVKIYLASFEDGKRQELIKKLNKPINILISYYYIKDKKTIPRHKDLLLDSGGFSARTQNVKINLDEYIKFIKKYKIKKYFNLDDISLEQTQKNQKELESKGLTPIPIWHPQYGGKELRRLTEKYNYIGVGNITGGKVGSIQRRIKVLNYLRKYPKTKFHLFGVTSIKILEKYSKYIYSTDSSSWQSGGRYGTMYFFNKGKIKLKKVKNFNKLHYLKIDYWNLIQWSKYIEYMEEKENAA